MPSVMESGFALFHPLKILWVFEGPKEGVRLVGEPGDDLLRAAILSVSFWTSLTFFGERIE